MNSDAAHDDKPSPDASEHDEALARIKQRRDLGAHAVVFTIFNAAAWAVWLITGHGYPWPAWVTGGWGIGLVLNAWDVYGRRPITEADVRREMDRLHPQH